MHDRLSNSGAPVDGAAAKNPAFAHGGLWKVGIAAAVVAGLALVFAGGWWFGTKRNTRSSRSSGGDSSSERDRREAGGSSGLKAGDTKTFTLPGGVEMEMVYVAPGSFTMGSPESEEGRYNNETPHRVMLTKGFWIGKFPVTQRQWQALVRANGVSFAEGEPTPYFSRDGKGRDRVSGIDTSDFPMEKIGWNDFARYCRSAYRGRLDPGDRSIDNGFRLCCSAGPRGEAEPGGRVTETPPKRSGRRPARAGAHGKFLLWGGRAIGEKVAGAAAAIANEEDDRARPAQDAIDENTIKDLK